jgi:diguanylate cyclase (GGDEF)-like protein/PAS domain S-box-containing protein
MALGTLCVIDNVPKQLTMEQRDALTMLARQVVRQLELRRTATQLRESETRFRQMFENNASILLLIDPATGAIVDANASAARFYGFSIDQLRAMSIDQINTLTPAEVASERHRAVQQDRNYFIFSHRLANGDVKTVEVRSTPIHVDARLLLFSIISDVTERTRIESALKASEDKFHKSFDLSPDAMTISRLQDGIYVSVNRGFQEIAGYCADEIVGHTSLEFDLWDSSIEREQLIGRLKKDGVVANLEAKFRAKDGRIRNGLTSAVAMEIEGVPHILSITRDITERIQAEQELRIAAVAFGSQNGMFITDPQGVILRVNSAFTRLTGYSAEEAVGKTPKLLKSGRQDPLFYQRMWTLLNANRFWQGEIWNKRKDGRIYAEMLNITAVATPELGITHYVASFTDITEDREATAEIHRLAYYDPLTRLPNRRLLQDRLGQALAATVRSRQYGAMFFIDLDNFKTLNDTRGHDAGDLMLVEVARRLRAEVREGDTVARQGGDEFVVLMEELGADVDEAIAVAKHLGEKLRETIDRPFILQGYEYHCKVSIGVSLFNAQDTVEELFKHADLALYQAKSHGRNTLRFFDPSMQAALDLRIALEAELRKALDLKQLHLHYQPQVDSARRVFGVEALLRWQHPQRGLVPPDDFIPLAEDTGLILPIGLWVLESACFQLKIWEGNAATRNLQVAVNVSARQFRQADFVPQVQRILEASGANPTRLKLELTESMVLENVPDAIEKMEAIKRLGVTLAMDDFGTGYSSLGYLAQLPLDQLKIDRSFVQNIPGRGSDETIARTIIAMGRGLAMQVIAEGVETEAQCEFLEANGCHAFQGYLFSRPLALDDFEEFVRRGWPQNHFISDVEAE